MTPTEAGGKGSETPGLVPYETKCRRCSGGVRSYYACAACWLWERLDGLPQPSRLYTPYELAVTHIGPRQYVGQSLPPPVPGLAGIYRRPTFPGCQHSTLNAFDPPARFEARCPTCRGKGRTVRYVTPEQAEERQRRERARAEQAYRRLRAYMEATGLCADFLSVRQFVPRCGAHTKTTGEPCRAHVDTDGNGLRCRVHGGQSFGPTTEEGRARIGESNRRRAEAKREAKRQFEEADRQATEAGGQAGTG